MGAAVTAEPKANKSKADVSPEVPASPSTFQQETAYGAPAGMPLFLALGLQRKLAVGAVDDPLEREADQVAEQIISLPELAIEHTALASPGGSLGHDDQVANKGFPTVRRRKGRADQLPDSSLPDDLSSNIGPGQPLDSLTRSSMERRFGQDFSRIRVHTGREAAQSAHAINALAYTAGEHIVFGADRYAPQSAVGRRLLAHELTHTLQQDPRAPGPIQADFGTDFTGRSQVRVADQSVRPPGSIRISNAAGEEVWAPYGIYTPQEVPPEYHDRIMESGKAFQWRNPNLPIGEAARLEFEREVNAGELTVGNMRSLSEGAGRNMNIRVMMAHVDNDFRFVGYDMSSVSGGLVTQGFVESEVGTAGVGRALFADRVVRALQGSSSQMYLEVYRSDRTESFHQQICRTAGVGVEPTEGMHYSLNTRQMVRIALAWSDGLSDAQRLQLVPLATGKDEPTPAQAQAILQAAAPGSGVPTSSGGFTAGNVEEMRRFGEEVDRNIRRPLEIERLEQLREEETAERIINEHAGFASLGGRLYRLQREGEGVRVAEVTTALIWQRVGPSPGPTAEAQPGPSGPQPVGLDPARIVSIGGQELENPADVTVAAGDVVIVNSQQTFEARDAHTGRPLIGIFEGGQWYRIVGPDGRNQEIEALTGEGVRPIEFGGQTVLAEPFEPEPIATPGGPGGGPGVAGGVVAAGGIIMVANEILGPIGAALQNQRARIREGEAEIDFWTALGANPSHAMWDVFAQAPAPHGTQADTAVFTTWYFPYVSDIDATSLRAQLPLRVHNYYELQLLLHSAQGLGAIQQEDNRWYAVVNRPARGQWHVYDITDTITTIQGHTLDVADSALRSRLAARPASERSGRLFRVPPGTTIYRSRGGSFNRQPLIDAGDRLGSNALVREIRRTDFVISTDMVFVEPVNADAYQAVAFAEYRINQKLEDAWHEAKNGGREVVPAELPSFGDGPLDSFRAGPETTGDRRFGWVNYTREPENPYSWTVARGEILAFWVSTKDIKKLEDEATALPQ